MTVFVVADVGHRVQNAVDSEADPDVIFLAFQMDVAGFELVSLLDQVGQHVVRADLFQRLADPGDYLVDALAVADLDVLVFDFFGRVIKAHILVEAGFGNYREAQPLVGKTGPQASDGLLRRGGGDAEMNVMAVGDQRDDPQTAHFRHAYDVLKQLLLKSRGIHIVHAEHFGAAGGHLLLLDPDILHKHYYSCFPLSVQRFPCSASTKFKNSKPYEDNVCERLNG